MKLHLLKSCKKCFRFIDDFFLLESNNHMMRNIFPTELVLVPDSFDGSYVSLFNL